MLIGREHDLERLEDALARHRLVTLAGPGGVGKTTLARTILDSRVERSGFVDLVSVSADGMLEGVAGALGFVSFADLLRVVSSDEWLVVMDNCEHVLDPAASVVETLLDGCPGLRMVATSREPLALDDEMVLRLDPLGTEGSPSPAARLFLDRARARGADGELDIGAVEALCRQLDGLPLAIELAAAKAAAMTPQEIGSRLTRSINALDQRRHRGPARHRGLAATIAWSIDQLDPPLAEAFDRLAVFEGRFSVGMAAAAMGEVSNDPHETLGELAQRSLVVHETLGDESWFRMLDTIRAFGMERLVESGRRDEAWERVVDGVVRDLQELGRRPIMGENELPTSLYHGFATVRAVAAHLVANDDAGERSFSIVGSLWWLEDIGHQTEAAEMIGQMVDRWPEPVPEAGLAYGIVSTFHRLAGRRADAEESARIAISAGSPAGVAFGQRCLGQMARNRQEWQTAVEHFEAGSAAARAIGETALAIEIEMHIAMTHARAGDLDRGVELLRRLEVEARPFHLCHNWVRLFLAWLLMSTDHDETRRISEDVITEKQHVASQWALASAGSLLAVADGLDGDRAAAIGHLIDATERFLAINNTTDILMVHVTAAALLMSAGEIVAATESIALGQRLLDVEAFGPFEFEVFDRLGGLPALDDLPANPSWRRVRAALLALVAGGTARSTETGVAGVFRRRGEYWEVGLHGTLALVADAKGLHDIATLLTRPGSDVAALDLMGSGLEAGGAGDASDQEARRAYELRIAELQSEIDTAAADNDSYRAERAREQLDELVVHLSASYGLGGKGRVDGDAAEKARSAVTWRIRSSIKKLWDIDATLAAHLDASITTGRFCTYRPSDQVVWEL